MPTELPNSSFSVNANAVAGQLDDNFLHVFVSPSGTNLMPRRVTNLAAFIAEFGKCAAADLAGLYFDRTKKALVCVKLPTVTAGAVALLVTDGVTGTSVVTVAASGDGIYDEFECIFEVLTGCTIGVDGGKFRFSLDGGRTYTGALRLGTASSYVIADTGMTVSFAAGALVAGDVVTWHTTAPLGDSQGYQDAIEALKAQQRLFRLGIVGDELTATPAADIHTKLVSYATYGRPQWMIGSARDWYHDAVMRGEPSDVDFDGTADTITRNTGSWITDGFKIGMRVTIEGSASNDGTTGKITNVTATVLTFASGLVTEANVNGNTLTITASELETDWLAQTETDFATVLYDEPRIALARGRGRVRSILKYGTTAYMLRRPCAWADFIREAQNDPHVMTSRVEDGALLGWTILDEHGNTLEHDDRLQAGASVGAMFIAFRTFDQEALGSVFINLPVMRCSNPDAALSRCPIRSVVDLYCITAKVASQKKLSKEVDLNPDGTIETSEASKIDAFVKSRLEQKLQTAPHVMVSDLDWTISREQDLRAVGIEVEADGFVELLGYIERITTRVRLSSPVEG